MLDDFGKRLPVKFFETARGAQPVREWLKDLVQDDRRIIGADVKEVEFGWPKGMPLCRPISGRRGLWEVRSTLTGGRIARILFCIHDGQMILLHGFEKTDQKTPVRELDVAVKRMKELSR